MGTRNILILGGDGMLGHQLWRHFSGRYNTRLTVRREFAAYKTLGLFDAERTFDGVDVRSLPRLAEVFAAFRPDIVVNAVGLIKQRPTGKDKLLNLEINAVLPHQLALLCQAAGARLIHPSTDCVFSGEKGNYSENDPADALDVYGKSKYLGEVSGPGLLTLRTSIIGRELSRKASMLEWFLNAPDPVNGFTRAIYSGLTTHELCRVIERVVSDFPTLEGVYHVASAPIAKYDLLCLINEKFALGKQIRPERDFRIDRSLDATRFHQATGYTAPSWPDMIEELAKDVR